MQSIEVPRGRNSLRSRRQHLRLLTGSVFLITAQVALICPSMSLAAKPAQAPPGVHIDPGSPAAKQYAIPLTTARGGPTGSSGSGTLFGGGISRAPSTSTATGDGSSTATSAGAGSKPAGARRPGRARRGAAQSGTQRSSRASASTPASTSASSTPPAAAKVLRSGSSSGLVWMLIAAAVIMILGAAGSFALTSRRRSTPSAG